LNLGRSYTRQPAAHSKLVCPVTSHGARSRRVWLPAGTRWRDAWTGDPHDGGTKLDAAAPLERIPVFAAEGSALVPLLQL
jgi:alpha-D-xyloside xylohydrolase